MRKLLKDHFIPHEGNDYQPHFLRLKVVTGILALIFVVEGLYLVQTLVIIPKSDYLAAIFAVVLVEQTNEARAAEALATLTQSPILEAVAKMKAEDMAAKGYFAHNSPEGKTPWYWFKQAGYAYLAAGENLAVNFTDSKDVTDAWMSSPSHRANILHGNYTEIGIATAQGVYKDRDAIFVVEVFGLPAKTSTSAGWPTTVLRDNIAASPTNIITPTVETTKSPVVPVPTITPAPLPTPVPTPPATVVAGAETSVAKELSVETVDLGETNAPLPEVEVLPSVVYVPANAPFLAALLASPRHLTMALYMLFAAIVLVALALAIFINIRIQHPHLIASGLLLLVIIVFLALANSSMSLAQAVI